VQGGNFINFEPDFGKSISQAFFFETNVVGVDEMEDQVQTGMHVFPNPSNSQFNVRLNGWMIGDAVQWNIRDINGRVALQGTEQLNRGDLLVLRLGSLSDGTYALTISNKSGQKMTRWIQLSQN
jgi:hypothetical protein